MGIDREITVRPNRLRVLQTLRHVRQDDDSTDCGIACLAMLTGLSWEQSFEALFSGKSGCEVQTTATTTAMMVAGLRRCGLVTADRLRPVRGNWERLSDLCLVKVLPRGCKWHWIVFERSEDGRAFVYDPEWDGAYALEGYDRDQPTSYLAVGHIVNESA